MKNNHLNQENGKVLLGQVVQLASGGPAMTLALLENDEDALVEWFETPFLGAPIYELRTELFKTWQLLPGKRPDK